MWISVDVGLPHNDEQVLLAVGGDVVAGYRDGRRWWYMTNDSGEILLDEDYSAVSHWMPFPKPPKAGD